MDAADLAGGLVSIDLAELEVTEEAAPELTEGERNLLTYLRFGAITARQHAMNSGAGPRAFYSFHELLLRHGRVFTPAPLPKDLATGLRWEDVHDQADERFSELVYVEGFSTSARMGWMAIEHCWCARLPGGVAALDTVWNPVGGAYVGVPLTHRIRWQERRSHCARQVLSTFHHFGRHVLRWGLPPDAVVPGVGRPIPAAATMPEL